MSRALAGVPIPVGVEPIAVAFGDRVPPRPPVDPRRWRLAMIGALLAACADDATDATTTSSGGTTTSSGGSGTTPTSGGSGTTTGTSDAGGETSSESTTAGPSTSSADGADTTPTECCEPAAQPTCAEVTRCCFDGTWQCYDFTDAPCSGGVVCAGESGDACVWEEGGCEVQGSNPCCEASRGQQWPCCLGGPDLEPMCTFYCFGL